jgi:hypothetical protein
VDSIPAPDSGSTVAGTGDCLLSSSGHRHLHGAGPVRFSALALDTYLPRPILSLIYLWHLLFVVPSLLIVGPIAISKGILALARWFCRARPRQHAEDGITRREFLTSAISLSPAIITGGAALASEAQLDHFRVRSFELSLPTLPACVGRSDYCPRERRACGPVYPREDPGEGFGGS